MSWIQLLKDQPNLLARVLLGALLPCYAQATLRGGVFLLCYRIICGFSKYTILYVQLKQKGITWAI